MVSHFPFFRRQGNVMISQIHSAAVHVPYSLHGFLPACLCLPVTDRRWMQWTWVVDDGLSVMTD